MGENASRLLPNSELHILMPQADEADLMIEAWDEKWEELAAIFMDFLDSMSACGLAGVRPYRP